MATTVLVLALYALVTARVTRFITADKLAEPFRLRVAKRFPPPNPVSAPNEPHWFTYLVHCAWCTSIWVAALFAVPAAYLAGVSMWWAPALALAASQLTGLMTRWESE